MEVAQIFFNNNKKDDDMVLVGLETVVTNAKYCTDVQM